MLDDVVGRALRNNMAAMNAGARTDVENMIGRQDGVSRRARPQSLYCRGRAGAAACRAAAHCRADAARSRARRARKARPSGPSRSGWPAGYAGFRRPTATPNCATGSDIRGPTSLRKPSRSRISLRTRSPMARWVSLSAFRQILEPFGGGADRKIGNLADMRPSILTASASGLSRKPLQAGQGAADI